MSAKEFISWVAYLRRAPVGGRWLNLRLAELMREIAKGHPRDAKSKVPSLDHYLWKPPEPLLVTRKKKEAKERRERKALKK